MPYCRLLVTSMTMIEVFAFFRVILYLIVAGYAVYRSSWLIALTMLMTIGIAMSRALHLPPEVMFVFSNVGGSLVAYTLYRTIKSKEKRDAR